MNTTPPPLEGSMIDGRYAVRRHLADGGMGRIYVAHDERLERDVALKILKPEYSKDPHFVERFRREARAAARLSHPHVVAVHDQGRDGAHVFLAMELIRGRTLRDVIADGGTRVEDALRLADQMLDGLSAAHRAGLVHRDIKPENVLITADGYVKVADFGLAHAISATGFPDPEILMGTASYLAPEQVLRQPADERSDVYAAGLVVFELLTGIRAFDGPSPTDVAQLHVHGDAPAPSSVAPQLGTYFDALIARVCSKDPNARPRDAGELRRALAAVSAHLPKDVREHVIPRGQRHTGATLAGVTQDANSTARYGSSRTHVLPPGPTAPGRSRRLRTPFIVAGAALVGLAIATLWLFLIGPLSPKPVPDVHGQTRAAAVTTLRDAGFEVRVEDVDSDEVASGRAVGTDPKAGTDRRPHSQLVLKMSRGPKQIQVPDVVGNLKPDAERKITSAGLVVGATSERPDASPAGTVIGVEPKVGTAVRHDSTVTLVLSTGPQEMEVPDLSDSSRDDAVKALESLGLKVKVVDRSDPDVDKGHVISTDPGAGTTVKTGDTLELAVSSGPEMVTVPDVVGKSGSAARRDLKDAKLKVDGGSWIDDLLDKSVSDQSPAAGTEVPEGTQIHLSF